MEGSGEVNSEVDKAFSDKKWKRTVKTPAQVEALENFYDEHKYPSEIMKLELAEKIGLTERQVSSWFCHRRLKDKRLSNGEMHANGRQDRSSGVVQDSCGSTKQGQNKTQDPIEVQSSRFNTQQLSAPRLTLEHGSHQAGNYGYMDDSSSESSSAPLNLNSKVDHVPKFSAENAMKPRSGPSGYLKVKGRYENPAITAVKMQLGAHYRDDGPPLGIEFDPLPPGAFEPLTQQPEETLNSSETYSAEEHVVGPDVQGIHQEYTSKPYHIEEDNLLHSRLHRQHIPRTVLDGKNSKMVHKSGRPESLFFQKQPKQEFSEQRSVDMAIYDERNKYQGRPMSSAGGSRRGAPAVHRQFQPYRGEVNQEQEEPWMKNSHGRMPKVEKRDSFNLSYSHHMVRGPRNDAYGDIGLPPKAAKVDNFYGIKRENDDDVTVRPRIPRKNEFHMVKDEYHQHVRKV